ncbi:MMPL family transporter [Amycolatopsis sp. H20-H5]|uniref:MMPL family transporter n=1 Tax=Amycolatopsis sp. H20-H5 TaxID=3046309 RepID=UPI002DB7970E|nr:MMPL family transporter [Amycolatopsis sp. H20-H5]MEC3974270.1 MMPL family transporter [Amycolatopsis sp. H20-H5]
MLLVPAFSLAGMLGSVQKNDISAWLPNSSESAKFFAAADKFQAGGTMPTIVVYARPSGLTAADVAKVNADAVVFQRLGDVTGQVQLPLVADDLKAVATVVPVRVGESGWTGIAKVVDSLNDIAAQDAGGLVSHVTGPGGFASDSGKAFGDADLLMIIAVLVVVGILLCTYRSPVLWLLPVIAAVAAVFTSEAVIATLAKYAGVVVNSQSSFILSVLVFGAATDYALLLIARYREELRVHADRHEAMGNALRRSGPAIVASAATVAVSLLVLMLATVNSTSGLGPVCAVGIVVALLAMMTLLPALLVICGRWIFWPVKPTFGAPRPTRDGLWTRIGGFVARKPRLIWIGTAGVLGSLTLGMLGLHAEGIPQDQQFTKVTDAVIGGQLQSLHFPAGAGNPICAVVDSSTSDQVRLSLSLLPAIATVVRLDAKDGRTLILATPRAAAGSPEALATARQVRDVVHQAGGADASVGAGSAVTVDMQDGAARDSLLVIPAILLLVFSILVLLLRALVAPLVLVATVVLSFGAAMGISVVVFDHVFHFGGMDAAFPLQAFTFLVALGVDYNIFLVTRVREESLVLGTRQGALAGLTATGGVISSAGLVLAGTFAAMASLPMVFAAELGFTVAVGVLIDTFLVRSVLVTALTLDLGEAMWWPRRPDPRKPVPEVGRELTYIGTSVHAVPLEMHER